VPSSTKDRILDVTADLFRRYGYTGTGLKQVVGDAQAPFGSLYHFFPGGKEQLGVEVIHRSGRMYFELFVTVFDAAPDPVQGVADFFEGAAAVLRETDYADACPIATAEVFESWVTGAADRLAAHDVPAGRARELAVLIISVLEGAFVLSRAGRSTEPLEVAGAAATAATRAALPDRG